LFGQIDANLDSKNRSVIARSVLVDMEPKVVQQATQFAAHTGLWRYDMSNTFTKQSGSANNWAFGYNTHATSVKEPVLDIIQAEAEKCDSLSGFLVVMSLAGGTGSGLGTFLTEELRDYYPHSFIVNQPVWPFQDGEVIVQNYNAILSMSHLAQVPYIYSVHLMSLGLRRTNCH
jgi:tubulin delta